MADAVRLAELVCARFSHDLSGLLGSLCGVLELLAEQPGETPEEVTLAVETATEMMDRLRLLRAAWGGVSEPLNPAGLRRLGGAVLESRRIRLDLDGIAAETVLPAPAARLVLNVLLLAAEALPRGGVVALSGDPATRMVAQIAGVGAAWPAGLALCLADEAHAWSALGSPRTLQPPLTALLASAAGLRLSLLLSAGAGPAGPPPMVMMPR
jgi:histidine phosphotransferase ChpT